MEKIIVDAVSGIDRLGEVLDSIAALSSEADGIKKQLKEDAELFGDCVAFNGASYTATAAARPPNGLPTGTGSNVGETPMQMHDRVATESTFDRDLRTCMTDKGYTLAP